MQCINIIKGLLKSLIIFKRQSRDQIQMLMNIFTGFYPIHCPVHFLQTHGTMNLTNRISVGGLHPDLKLDQSRTHIRDQLQFVFSEQIRRNLKMKIRNAVIMFLNIFPDSHGMLMLTVKSTIYKFYLRHFSINKKLQFFVYKRQTAKPQLFVHGGQTVTAVKRTSTAGFIINDPVFKVLQIRITKRKFIHRKQIAQRLNCHCSIGSAIGNTIDFFQHFLI